jgi:hypothetical protein
MQNARGDHTQQDGAQPARPPQAYPTQPTQAPKWASGGAPVFSLSKT